MRAVGTLVSRLVWLVLLLALALVVVTATRVVLVSRDDDRRASDAVVVLGAAQFDGEPSPVLMARLEHAKTLYDDGVAPRVITTGGSLAGDRFTEAESGQIWLTENGVPESDIVVVPTGSDTLTSVEAVAPVMDGEGWDSAVVVTDPPHILRSVTMLGDLGVDAVGSPATETPGSDSVWAQTKYVARETAGYLYYQLQRLTS